MSGPSPPLSAPPPPAALAAVTRATLRPSGGPDQRHGERGFNLVELLISLSIATILLMAIVTLFVKQTQVMSNQTAVLDMQRGARFGMEHLTRDLAALGSNSTPNSVNDPLVCPKPAVPLRAVTLSLTDGYVAAPEKNPNVRPVAIRLFGTLDVKSRWKTANIDGSTVYLYDDGTLPATEELWNNSFGPDKYLRIAAPDGKQMYFAISDSSFAAKSVQVTEAIPRQEVGQPCGYTGFGNNLWVDVQNFVRYRIVADTRPGAATGTDGTPLQSILVRERLGTDGTTVVGQLPLVDNAVDLSLFDIALDNDPASDVQKIKIYPLVEDVVTKDGAGKLGSDNSARPESLRFLTVKLSVRSDDPVSNLAHRPRDVVWQPLDTWQLPDQTDLAHPVVTAASRVAMPTLVSRNL